MTEPTLKLDLVSLRLKRPFTLSQASATSKTTLIARHGNGFGEGSSSIHYGVSSAEALEQALRLWQEAGQPSSRDSLDAFQRSLPETLNVARCAIETALLDHAARVSGQPLWQYLKLQSRDEIVSSFTITFGDAEDVKRQLELASDFGSLKLKVGFGGDIDFVEQVLKSRETKLRLDANGGWTRDETLDRMRVLRGYPIEFVEQPLKEPTLFDLDRIKNKIECPLVLDESIRTTNDIARFERVIDGVNLKLSKCGGILPVLGMAERARAGGLKLLLGCMVESAIGITAAAHLASEFDWFDLDAILLTENDPFWGAHFDGDRIILPGGSGLGISIGENTLA